MHRWLRNYECSGIRQKWNADWFIYTKPIVTFFAFCLFQFFVVHEVRYVKDGAYLC